MTDTEYKACDAIAHEAACVLENATHAALRELCTSGELAARAHALARRSSAALTADMAQLLHDWVPRVVDIERHLDSFFEPSVDFMDAKGKCIGSVTWQSFGQAESIWRLFCDVRPLDDTLGVLLATWQDAEDLTNVQHEHFVHTAEFRACVCRVRDAAATYATANRARFRAMCACGKFARRMHAAVMRGDDGHDKDKDTLRLLATWVPRVADIEPDLECFKNASVRFVDSSNNTIGFMVWQFEGQDQNLQYVRCDDRSIENALGALFQSTHEIEELLE